MSRHPARFSWHCGFLDSKCVCVCVCVLHSSGIGLAGWLAGRGGLDSDGAPVLGCRADGLDTIVLSGRMTA